MLWDENGQYLAARRLCRDSVIITNLGISEKIDEQLAKVGCGDLPDAGKLLGLYHDRGTDELPNRALKTFGYEQLPFKRFIANST